uniref:Protein kinase domain-containing protein n=1 Tax=Rhabditophanes sp. KR3021 TaxID=114890 RepID=A0AC35U080_9BILA
MNLPASNPVTNIFMAQLKDYIRMENIGAGTYGIVFTGRCKLTNQTVALKKIKLDPTDEGVPATVLREIAMLRELRYHPCIVMLDAVILETKKLYLVFEHFPMDLKKYMDKHPTDEVMKAETVMSYMYQICHAMCYCHKRRVLHRDLKPANLLVNHNGIIKLADFGLARSVGVPLRAYTHEIVTLWYRAPEILLGIQRYSTSVDIWSIACIFAEMATIRPLFPGDSEIDQLYRIFRTLSTPTEESWPGIKELPDYKGSFPKWTQCHIEQKMKSVLNAQGIDLLMSMLRYNPNARSDLKQILKHPYFDTIDHSKAPFNEFEYQN